MIKSIEAVCNRQRIFGYRKMECVIFGDGGFICSIIENCLLLDGFPLSIFERPRAESFHTFKANEKVERIAVSFPSSQHVGYDNAGTSAEGLDLG